MLPIDILVCIKRANQPKDEAFQLEISLDPKDNFDAINNIDISRFQSVYLVLPSNQEIIPCVETVSKNGNRLFLFRHNDFHGHLTLINSPLRQGLGNLLYVFRRTKQRKVNLEDFLFPQDSANTTPSTSMILDGIRTKAKRKGKAK
jgi:hypothetical protein